LPAIQPGRGQPGIGCGARTSQPRSPYMPASSHTEDTYRRAAVAQVQDHPYVCCERVLTRLSVGERVGLSAVAGRAPSQGRSTMSFYTCRVRGGGYSVPFSLRLCGAPEPDTPFPHLQAPLRDLRCCQLNAEHGTAMRVCGRSCAPLAADAGWVPRKRMWTPCPTAILRVWLLQE
jgi:hypothetical protein